ncbi:phospholipase A and acyltransferase 3-like isoform X2 [Hemicordylus capensis]|uniref:phospholipase A and acyltransferase 3-like isoform X2 n=1 Tax=Hemicordylus capensis TaxID=884348 RepID=UPI00230391DD|nr:phospholipase A and acyltransferase 3-like isoform X2 [Hemicordylus capensis]
MGLEGKNPKPGDLIEIFRGLYKHWAIYIGGGFVVHVTSADGIAGVCSSCSPSVPAQKAVVKKELLKDVVGPNRAWVNNVNDTKSNPRAVEEILRDAKNYLGREISYNLIMSNCEHFAKYLRYGIPESEQVTDGLSIGLILGAVVSVLMALVRQ